MRRALLLIAGAALVAGCAAAPTPDPAPASAPPSPTVAATAAAPLTHPVRVEIPALGVVDELVPVGLEPSRQMEIPPVDKVGFYELARLPGERGPAVLAGHVNYNGVPGSFGNIGRLQSGDVVSVADQDGRTLRFEVYEVRQFPKAAPDWSFVFGDRGGSELVLVTCSGDVVNHRYQDNTAVAARLVQS